MRHALYSHARYSTFLLLEKQQLSNGRYFSIVGKAAAEQWTRRGKDCERGNDGHGTVDMEWQSDLDYETLPVRRR